MYAFWLVKRYALAGTREEKPTQRYSGPGKAEVHPVFTCSLISKNEAFFYRKKMWHLALPHWMVSSLPATDCVGETRHCGQCG